MLIFEKEIINDFFCKLVSKFLKPFGFNRFTYKIFSFFYGFGYKYSFGSIRFQDNKEYLYMEFMPWYFGNKSMVKKNIYNKIMLYGALDYLNMINYFEKHKTNIDIRSNSNKEIAFLINRKLGFKFKKFKNIEEAIKLSDSNNFELFINTTELITYKKKIKRYISTLKNFENRN